MDKKKEIIQWLVIINLTLAASFLFSKTNFILYPISTIFDAIFFPVVLAVFLYYLVRPLKRFLESRRISSGIATGISMALVIGILSLMVYYTVTIFATQGQGLFDSIIASTETLNDKYKSLAPEITKYLKLDGIMANISSYLKNSAALITKNIYLFISSIGNFLTQLILIPIIMFYILKDDRKIFSSFFRMIPIRTKSITYKIFKDTDTILKHYITCQIMVASVIGLLMFIGYVFIGMPNALVLALFTLITAFIPFLGVILGILPALIIALSMGFGMVVKVILLTVVVQQLEGNVITPNITGNQLDMHPLTTIIVVTVSVYFGGFLAAFIAVPLYNIIKVVIKNLYAYFTSKENIS